jgi:hypothetical protein
MTICAWPQSLDRNTGLVNLNLVQNIKLKGWNMPEKENNGLEGLVLKAIISSQKNVVTCQEIKDILAEQGIDQYSRDAIIETMKSISAQRGGEFKSIIVTRHNEPPFAIRKIERFL